MDYVFRERSTSFSLGYLVIRPSAVFSTRGRTALRGEGFAWVPDIGSFFKLLEVGFSPYLSFIPILSVLSMFESSEAMRGRLIGPKPWDRIDKNFETKCGAAVYGYGLIGCSLCTLCIKCLLGMHWAGNGRGLRVH